MWFGLLGCVEYGVNTPPDPPAPEVEVTPTTIDVPMVCGTAVQEVRVQNTGTGPLTILTLAVDGSGWTLDPVDLPATVAPGEELGLDLTAVDGTATLTIGTDDADEPSIVVSLAAAVNTPPDALITSPWEEQFVGMEEALSLTAVVSDDQSGPTELVATWSDSLTGEVAVEVPDEGGRLETEWDPSVRAPGPQVMYLTIEDPCGATGSQSVFFCQDGPFPVDALTDDAWIRNGDVALDDDAGVLTLGPSVAATFDGSGIYDPDQLEVSFDVVVSGAGFSLTALDAERRDAWIGGDGCALGFGDCAAATPLPGWSLVFDFVDGDGNDCGPAPSVGLTLDGAQSAFAACAALPADLDDGAAHAVRVYVAGGTLTVEIDGEAVELEVETGTFAAYLGFTSAGADLTVSDLVFTDFTCDCEAACDN